MEQDKFFETVVEPSTERLGLFGIVHESELDGRTFTVTHKVSKNVVTDFDSKLSRYQAAVQGAGLPGASVETWIKDPVSGRSWMPFPARHVPSVPHALATAVKLALGWDKSRDVRVGAWANEGIDLETAETVSTDTVDILERALDVCKQIGTFEFLEVSGDFKRLLVKPLGSDMGMIVLDLHRGLISIPSTGDGGQSEWQGPLHGFEKAAAESQGAVAFLAKARHAVALAKERAIFAFREAAEDRIMRFDKALAGRPLSGYRLESAGALVARLKAAMGDNLLGLDEAAQITALEWAAELREEPGASAATAPADEPFRPAVPRLVG